LLLAILVNMLIFQEKKLDERRKFERFLGD
jgi:hypothetical protein